MSENCDIIVIFPMFGQFQSGSRIPDALSVKLIFLLTVISYLTKTENKIKKLLTQLCLSKGIIFAK